MWLAGLRSFLAGKSCAGPVLVGLSWGKALGFFFLHLHTGDESMGLRAYVYQTQNL